jgi:hypothetical protein
MLLAPAGSSSAAADGSADATDASTQVTPWRLKVIDYGCSGFCLPGQQLHEAVGTVRAAACWGVCVVLCGRCVVPPACTVYLV